MKGWQIFRHSVRQVFGNLPVALRISGLLYLVQFVVALALGFSAVKAVGTAGDDAAALAAMQTLLGPALLVLVVVIVADLWIAVAWHRYVLTVETSPSLIPVFEGRRMLGYFGTGLLIASILILPALVAATILATFVQSIAPLDPGQEITPAASVVRIIGQGVLQAAIGVVGLRLSTVVAGVSLQPGHRLAEGWQATRGETGAFLQLAAICAACLVLVQLVETLVLPDGAIVQIVWGFVMQWIITMVGVSVLTTLYGHYIQKRPLI